MKVIARKEDGEKDKEKDEKKERGRKRGRKRKKNKKKEKRTNITTRTQTLSHTHTSAYKTHAHTQYTRCKSYTGGDAGPLTAAGIAIGTRGNVVADPRDAADPGRSGDVDARSAGAGVTDGMGGRGEERVADVVTVMEGRDGERVGWGPNDDADNTAVARVVGEGAVVARVAVGATARNGDTTRMGDPTRGDDDDADEAEGELVCVIRGTADDCGRGDVGWRKVVDADADANADADVDVDTDADVPILRVAVPTVEKVGIRVGDEWMSDGEVRRGEEMADERVGDTTADGRGEAVAAGEDDTRDDDGEAGVRAVAVMRGWIKEETGRVVWLDGERGRIMWFDGERGRVVWVLEGDTATRRGLIVCEETFMSCGAADETRAAEDACPSTPPPATSFPLPLRPLPPTDAAATAADEAVMEV